jgi:6-phosphofructokinase 1
VFFRPALMFLKTEKIMYDSLNKEASKIKKIALLTSGGDSPGMNAAIRSIVRTAIFNGLEVEGVLKGYYGLLNDEFIEMKSHTVSKIISDGGTILQSSRCPEFKDKENRKKAYNNLAKHKIDALIVLGGDGSFRGADVLRSEIDIKVVGLPCTIDNDIYGTDFTIGFDTAINTAVEAVDKIRDTADSHNIVFFVEVMGRHSGFIAINTGISTGAEAILLPEVKSNITELCTYLEKERRKNKTSGIIIVAEGDDEGDANTIAQKVKERLSDYETRVTTLGHVQRGGSPTSNDRVLASILGYEAVGALLKGKNGVMIGHIDKEIVFIPFKDTYTKRDKIDKSWIEISKIISM